MATRDRDPLDDLTPIEIIQWRRFTRNRWMFLFDRAKELADEAAVEPTRLTDPDFHFRQNLIRHAGFAIYQDAKNLGMFGFRNPDWSDDRKLISPSILIAALESPNSSTGIIVPKFEG